MEIQSNRQKLRVKEDRISDLPDHLIHHILSFLPSTKQAIQTGILSKRWRKQWIHVPVLIFDPSTRMSSEKFLKSVENTLILHDCSKIKKFHFQYPYSYEHDPHFQDKILFATRKHVEELYLRWTVEELLPKFLFSNVSLTKLTAFGCAFIPNETVNWGSLTALHVCSCRLTDEALQHILSGTPLLNSLELNDCYKIEKLVIVSESLKRLVLRQKFGMVLEISCPNLLELCMVDVFVHDTNLFAQAIDNVLSTSPSLESFELKSIIYGELHQLLIASKSLKRLVLSFTYNFRNIQISCPHLQELELRGCLRVRALKLLDLPSSLCGTLDLYHTGEWKDDEYCKRLVQDIMHQLHHVKELVFGSSFIACLSTFEEGGTVPFVLNLESLTLNYPNLVHHGSGIACVLRNAPVLEKLVINMRQHYGNLKQFNDSGESFWNSNATIFNCLLPQLKTIEIIGFPQRYDELNLVVNFIQYLLKNAIVLEKMVIVLKGEQESLPLKVSYQLLHLPRCSKHAIIELLYSQ